MKNAYLTIDDSPSDDMKQKIDFLKSKNIPAIWFCRGDFMEKKPEAVIYAIQNQFIVGNHAYSHRHFSELPLSECEEEIRKTDKLIEDLYQAADVTRKYRVFRFPYGDKGDLNKGMFRKSGRRGKEKKQVIQQLLRSLGYSQPKWKGINYKFFENHDLNNDADCSWTFDVMEWSTHLQQPVFGIRNLPHVLDRLNDRKPRDCRLKLRELSWMANPASAEIILLHDQPETSGFFEPIVDKLLNLQISFQQIPLQ